jgi:hypothetical protein
MSLKRRFVGIRPENDNGHYALDGIHIAGLEGKRASPDVGGSSELGPATAGSGISGAFGGCPTAASLS